MIPSSVPLNFNLCSSEVGRGGADLFSGSSWGKPFVLLCLCPAQRLHFRVRLRIWRGGEGELKGPGRAGAAAAPDEMTRTAAACSLCHDSAKTSEGAGYGELENPELDLVQVHLKEQAP